MQANLKHMPDVRSGQLKSIRRNNRGICFNTRELVCNRYLFLQTLGECWKILQCSRTGNIPASTAISTASISMTPALPKSPMTKSWRAKGAPGVVINGAVVHAGGVPSRSKVEGWL